MEKHQLTETIGRVMPAVRKEFLFPPLSEVELSETNPALPGGLVGRKVVINTNFVTRLTSELDLQPERVASSVIARSLNRFWRIPEDFLQVLRLYAHIREVVIDAENAKQFLETYLALWNEIDLYVNRGRAEDLIELYRASVASDQEKLKARYRVLVEVLQLKWGVDLGVELDEFWEHVVYELAEIDYLRSEDRQADIKAFGRLMSRYFTLIKEKTGKDPQKEEEKEEEPAHWPLETTTLENLGCVQDIRGGIIQFLDEYPDGMKILEEFSALSGNMKGLLGKDALLEGSRWWWYRHLAERYSLSVRKKPSEETGRVYRVSLTEWAPEDGIKDIAEQATFGPVGMPILTKKWLHSGPESHYSDRQVPDLLVAIDTSGSMTNSNSEKSYAVLGGFVAANTYLNYGSKVAVYNFSNADLVQDFTTDHTQVHKHLAAYQGGGTELNPDTLDAILKKSRREVDLLVITDMGLNSFEDTIAKLAVHAKTRRLFLILVNENQGNVEKAREQLPDDVQFYHIKDEADIPKIVLGAIERSFVAHRKEEEVERR